MSERRSITKKTRVRRAFGKGVVYLKYLSPAIMVLSSWFFCLMECVRFVDGKELYTLQSVNDMVSQALKSVSSYQPGKEDEYTSLLANALEPVTDMYVWSFIISALIGVYFLVFALIILPGDPLSPTTNRAKVWFKTFMPTGLVIPVSLLLSVYPTFMPYIIRYMFFKYYVMDNLKVVANVFNPAIAACVLAGALIVVYFAAIPFERRYRMNPYRRYDICDED